MGKGNQTPACRVYAILARDAHVGIIFRRGPSKCVQLIYWDLLTDEFTPGDWLYGRIYERRCDLSPYGNWLIYFAQKLNGYPPELTYAWTAMSIPPSVVPLLAWPRGNCWDGGGLFISPHELWPNHLYDCAEAYGEYDPHELTDTSNQRVHGEDLYVWHRHAILDGWQNMLQVDGALTEDPIEVTFERSTYADTGILRKRSPRGDTELLITTNWYKLENNLYSLRDAGGPSTQIEGAEWADWGKNGRLVFAKKGKVFAQLMGNAGHSEPVELIDLNSNYPPDNYFDIWSTGEVMRGHQGDPATMYRFEMEYSPRILEEEI